MENTIQVKKALLEAKNVLILTEEGAKEDILGAALALFFALKNLGKNINIPSIEEIPNQFAFAAKNVEQKSFLISLEKDISQVYYEKDKKGIKLYLTPKNDEIYPENLLCKMVSAKPLLFKNGDNDFKPDTIIGIGLSKIEKRPGQTTINISNDSSSIETADINVSEKYPSSSQAMAYFLKEIDESLIDQKTANCLLSGVVASSDNFSDPQITQATLPTINWLIKKGGDLDLVSNIEKEWPAFPTKLFTRTLKNLQSLKEKGIYYSTLEESDFHQSQSCSKDLAFVVEKIKKMLKIPSFLMLWKDSINGPYTKGIFYSDDITLFKKICSNFEGISKNDGILFLVRESDISKALSSVLEKI